MRGLAIQSFLLTFLLFNTIHGKKMCDYNNETCVTKRARGYYRTILSNFKESADPFYQEKIEQQIDDFSYILSNITVTGIQECNVTKLAYYTKEMTFDYYLRCPQLVLTADFNTSGTKNFTQLDGEGTTKITADDYVIIWRGGYDHITDENDQRLRILVLEDNTVDVKSKGNITFEITNLLSGDNSTFAEALTYMNEHWMEIEKVSRKTITNGLFRRFFDNFKVALKVLAIEDILNDDDN